MSDGAKPLLTTPDGVEVYRCVGCSRMIVPRGEKVPCRRCTGPGAGPRDLGPSAMEEGFCPACDAGGRACCPPHMLPPDFEPWMVGLT